MLVEVTMSEGRTQTVMEVWPITRHLEEFAKKIDKSLCLFVAPSIFADSVRQIDFVKNQDNLEIIPKTIVDFIDYLENSRRLYSPSS